MQVLAAIRERRQLCALILILALVAANVCVYRVVVARKELTVTVLDVGQGDAILLRGPTGVTVLVDGGPDASVLRELGAALPYGTHHIDAVVETHPDADHIGGLPEVFARYDIRYFLSPGIPDKTNAAAALAAAASAEPGLHEVAARRGMRLTLGGLPGQGGAYADILWPDRDPAKFDTNFGSVTMHVVYGSTSFMLMGDLPSPIENYLVRLDANDGELPSSVLKAGHHGSKTSTSDAWLAALSPRIVAISVGAGNRYGHPSQETLDRIASIGARILRTDQSGRIIFISNGTDIAVSP